MTSILDIEGIGKQYRDKLVDHGVKTTEKLLEVAGSKAGRAKLAEATGFSEAHILEWVNRADLMRVKGVGEEYSDLLEAAGVDSPAELAQRNAANLAAAMADYNDKHNTVNRAPSEVEVQHMIDHAKTLDKVVTH